MPNTSTTMRTLPRFSLCFSFFLILLLAFACRRSAPTDRLPEEARPYLAGYTTGLLSKAGPVRVRFTQPVVAGDQVGTEADPGLLRLQPGASGRLVWEDEQTLRFDPDPYLNADASYTATLALGELFDGLAREVRTVSFGFHTKKQQVELDLLGLYPASGQSFSEQELRGSLFTADVAAPDEVETLLQVIQAGDERPIRWQHSADLLRHDFVATGIARQAEESSLEIRLNGKAIGADGREERELAIPALGDFRIMRARTGQLPEPFIALQFSDPLQVNQNLEGLVVIEGYAGGLRYLIDGSELFLYPVNELTGRLRIIANPGIRNAEGRRMANASQWEVELQTPNPEIRLVGNGVIMPKSKGLLFPFEAIGLEAVLVEVFKIYDSNILQFLQANDLNGSDELYRVGRIVLQEELDLKLLNPEADAAQWTRYALDLSSLFQQDPEAIYQVRLGFRPEHATFSCPDGYTAGDTAFEQQLSEDGEIQSILDSWYGPSGYYRGYWEDRDDPCKPAYYNRSRFAQRNVIASNLGIIAKGNDRNEFSVIVTDLLTTQSVSGAELTFFDFQNQPIGRANTGGNGLAEATLERKPHLVVAAFKNQKGYLRLVDGNALSLSRFDVDGVQPQKGLKGYFYAERGVWRPGDSVFLHFVLEDATGELPDAYPVTLELYDPRGQLYSSQTQSGHLGRIYPFHMETASEAPTGLWRAEVKVGAARFRKNLRIETIKPNRLAIELSLDGEEIDAAVPIEVGLKAKWLHGAPASGFKARVEAQLDPINTIFERWKAYEFDDPTRSVSGAPLTLFDNSLNARGEATFTADLLGKRTPAGKMQARFRTRVFEPGGDFSTDAFSATLSPFSTYVGLKLPQNAYGQKRMEVGGSGRMEVVVVDNDGQPLPNRNLRAELYRVNWRWWWEQDRTRTISNAGNYYEGRQEQNLSTNASGRAEWNLQVDDWGRYVVRICDTQSGHCTGDFLYVGYPYGTESADKSEAAMLAFTAEQEQYEVQDKVNLRIPASERCRALVSLETGTRLLETHWVELEPGDNTFSFSATADMVPNVYAHVSLIQPHGQVLNDRPMRMYGVIPIAVEDPATLLNPRLKMAAELKPNADFTVEVSEANGQAMSYTLAIVDEGLLGLTRFETPNPHKAFYAKEALGLRTWDVYDQVLGAYGGQLDRVLSIGGDGTVEPQPKSEDVNRFEPVVMHLGPFRLKKGQRARHQLNMPNYVGAVRAMVVASSGTGAYGAADETVPVKQPLMVLATLPRVLGPGESFRLPVNVFAMDEKVRDVQVRLRESSGLVRLDGNATQNLSFQRTGSQMAYFDLTVLEKVGAARFVLEASGGGETATQEIELLVRNPNPMATRVTPAILQAGESWSDPLQAVGMPGTNEAVLEVSNIPPLNLGQRLDYLLRYPYGCLEQTLSSGFPQLYVDRLMELGPKEKERQRANVEATIDRMPHFLTGTGGMAFWPGHSQPDHWATNYALHFLLEADARGYTVPNGLKTSLLDFQKKTARMWNPQRNAYGFGNRTEQQLTQAYRLYTLALARQPDLAGMNRLREQKEMAPQALWRLAAAYALAGKKEAAENLVQGLSMEVGEYETHGYTYGSSLRDRAMILETLLLLDDRQDAAAATARYISDRLGSSGWYSTQTTAYCLLAMGKLVGSSGVDQNLAYTYQLGGANPVNAGGQFPLQQIELDLDALDGQSIQVTNRGNAPLFVRLISRGQPTAGLEEATSNNLAINIEYLDGNGASLNPVRLEQGTDFFAKVTVIHPATRPMPYTELALNQIFPSGWEILNTRMDGLNRFAESEAEYRNVRDDRVYTFFDLREKGKKTFYVQLNAAYQGRFYLPGVSCESMYDPSISALESGRWVEVSLPGGPS